MDLLEASRREHALYRELVAAYRSLANALADPTVPVDPAWLSGRRRDADLAVDALRALAAALAPHRLTGAPVSADVREFWTASAVLAADARTANAEAIRLARERRAAIAARLARVGAGRRALAGYRPQTDTRAGFTHRHA